MAGSRRPNLVCMNDEHMGGRALGTQVGLVYPLGVITDSRGLGLVEEGTASLLPKCSHVSQLQSLPPVTFAFSPMT